MNKDYQRGSVRKEIVNTGEKEKKIFYLKQQKNLNKLFHWQFL